MSDPSRRLGPWLRLWSTPRALAAVGSAAMLVLCVALNILGARFYERFDLSPAGTYTLSEATTETLGLLKEPVDFTVFLSRDDPLFTSVKDMLLEYTAGSHWLTMRHVDPDRQPGEFVRLQNEYGLFQGKTQDGHLVADTAVVVARAGNRWLISADDLVSVESSGESVRPVLEHAFTEALRRVLQFETLRICVTTGHQELSITDGSTRGAEELKYRLERDNYSVRAIDPRAESADAELAECQLIVVAGPQIPWSRASVERIARRLQAGTQVMLALGPVVDADNRVTPSGFEALLEGYGVETDSAIVVERAEDRVLAGPAGGVVFLAEPQQHPITHALMATDPPQLVQLGFARPLSMTADSPAKPLLVSSEQAVAIETLRPGAAEPDNPTGRAYVLALALEPGEDRPQGRLVVLGSADLLRADVWRDPRRLYDKGFIESALTWLLARPPLVSIPARPAHPAGLNLTQDALDEVIRYVLLYMPSTVVLLGGLTLYRRRKTTPVSRKTKGLPPVSQPREGVER